MLVCAGSQDRGPFHLGGHLMARECGRGLRAGLGGPARVPWEGPSSPPWGCWGACCDRWELGMAERPRGLRCWRGLAAAAGCGGGGRGAAGLVGLVLVLVEAEQGGP